MIWISEAATATLRLVFKGVVLLTLIAIISGLFFQHDGAPSGRASAPVDERISVSSDAGKVRVTLNVAEKEHFSSYLFQDKGGRGLSTINLYQNGAVTFFWGDTMPVRASGSMTANGTVGFGLGLGRGVIQISQRAGPNGSSIVEISDSEERVMGRFRTTPEGLSNHELAPNEL